MNTKEAATSTANSCYIEVSTYRGLIKSLLCLIANRPDIMLFVWVVLAKYGICQIFELCLVVCLDVMLNSALEHVLHFEYFASLASFLDCVYHAIYKWIILILNVLDLIDLMP